MFVLDVFLTVGMNDVLFSCWVHDVMDGHGVALCNNVL